MPRRRQRFSDLERQFRRSGGVADPTSELGAYIEFKQGKRKINITTVLSAEDRKRYGFAIIPFNKAPSEPVLPTDRYAAAITKYSNDRRLSLTLSNLDLGYVDITAQTNQSSDFYPALLRVFIPTPGAVKTTPISAITGKEYTRTPGSSASIPFGRTAAAAATDTEEGRKNALMQAARTGASATVRATSVSYEPEVFKPGRAALASPII